MSFQMNMAGDPTPFLALLRGFLGQAFAPNGAGTNLVDLIKPFLGNTAAGTALNDAQMLFALLVGQQMNGMQTQMNSMQTQMGAMNQNMTKMAQAMKNAGFAVPPELLPAPTPAPKPMGGGSTEAEATFRRTLAQIDAVQSGRPLPARSPSADPESEFKRLLSQIDAVQKGTAPVVAETRPALVNSAK
jgi:hypothetical protein